MINLTGVSHHPAIEEIVDVLCAKTQNTDRGFFRAVAAYFLGKAAASMRVSISTKDRGQIPVNIYTLALANSGFGKGHSIHILENEFMAGFKNRFMTESLPIIAEAHLWKIANGRAAQNGKDPQEEFDKLEKEFKNLGAVPYTFDSGSSPAVKQLRQKLLLADCGAINLQIDEIGSNLIGSTEVLTLFLELYDQGMTKQKLTKNTADSKRSEEMDGKTPANALLFGTPLKLLDGGATEEQFYSFLEIGYARRCIFGMGNIDKKSFHSQTPEEIYQRLIQPSNQATVEKWADIFYSLADSSKYGWKVSVEDDVAIELIRYKVNCEAQSDNLPSHKEIQKSELSHRYFKALKLAGAFAFIDGMITMSLDHLKQAILLIEESGEAFQAILSRERSYVKLAKFIAAEGSELTHADLHETLPFYKGSVSARNELIALATAWGYKRHILIKKSFVDGIEFFRGETLKETDIDKMILSYSDHFAYNYTIEHGPFEQLHLLTQADGLHWCNHAFEGGHRNEDAVVPGFNMVVVDVDGGTSLSLVHDLLKDYKFMTYTTKRHTPNEHRFRIIIPINYHLELDADDYKEFMKGIASWLPFQTDESANQRSRKWLTFSGGSYHYNLEGEILDALKFIPKTSKNEAYKQQFQKVESLDNLERWFAERMASGNRNNHMIKFALALVDSGLNFTETSKKIYAFNKKLNNPLPEHEIDSTILVTVAKKLQGI